MASVADLPVPIDPVTAFIQDRMIRSRLASEQLARQAQQQQMQENAQLLPQKLALMQAQSDSTNANADLAQTQADNYTNMLNAKYADVLNRQNLASGKSIGDFLNSDYGAQKKLADNFGANYSSIVLSAREGNPLAIQMIRSVINGGYSNSNNNISPNINNSANSAQNSLVSTQTPSQQQQNTPQTPSQQQLSLNNPYVHHQDLPPNKDNYLYDLNNNEITPNMYNSYDQTGREGIKILGGKSEVTPNGMTIDQLSSQAKINKNLYTSDQQKNIDAYNKLIPQLKTILVNAYYARRIIGSNPISGFLTHTGDFLQNMFTSNSPVEYSAYKALEHSIQVAKQDLRQISDTSIRKDAVDQLGAGITLGSTENYNTYINALLASIVSYKNAFKELFKGLSNDQTKQPSVLNIVGNSNNINDLQKNQKASSFTNLNY